jgi:hypothetical protein
MKKDERDEASKRVYAKNIPERSRIFQIEEVWRVAEESPAGRKKYFHHEVCEEHEGGTRGAPTPLYYAKSGSEGRTGRGLRRFVTKTY